MGQIIDITGKTFGRLAVLKQSTMRRHGKIAWECVCQCGARIVVSGNSLKRGNTTSCGCRHAEIKNAIGDKCRTHGMCRTPEYASWCSMKDRCNNPNNDDYAHYGGRGIRICDRWNDSFEAFIADIGHKPFPRATVDRIQVNGNYEPGNCRWATQAEQTRNKRNNRRLTFNGVTRTLSEWEALLGFKRGVIDGRIKRGWSVELALSTGKCHRWSRRKSLADTA
jgi:hypothetical protein